MRRTAGEQQPHGHGHGRNTSGPHGYRLRLLATDVAGAALVVAVLVVDDERTDDLLSQAEALVGSLHATET